MRDGNIAFKCAYNDNFYKDICSDKIIDYNINIKKSLNCSRNEDECHCYEQEIFKYYQMGAGWSESKGALKIKEAKEGKLAILTTVKPYDKEVNRYIFGILYIEGFNDDDETYVIGNESLSIQIHKEMQEKFKFWNYYSNESNPNKIMWGTGLFRYISNQEIYKFLEDLIDEYEILILNRYIENKFKDIDELKSSLRIIESIFKEFSIYDKNYKRKSLLALLDDTDKNKKVNKEYNTKIRIGQSKFRERLLKEYSECKICGISNVNLLKASHIKPWKDCVIGEHLDENNGFLLCPMHDELFDKGYISFDSKGKIIISSSLNKKDVKLMYINDNITININVENEKYLKYHRKYVFIK